MGKRVVCLCEDVLRDELEQAIAAGNRDVESLKRYTGFGTGVCQGKSCVAHVARLLHDHGIAAERLAPFTPRPPVVPVPMRLLAAPDARVPGSVGGDPAGARTATNVAGNGNPDLSPLQDDDSEAR